MKKKRRKLNLRLYFVMLILIDLTIVSVAGAGITLLADYLFKLPLQLPDSIYGIIISFILAGGFTTFFSKWILAPITKLSQAMNQVAKGDFTVRLKEESVVTEIEDAYRSFNIMASELSATETLQSDFVSNVSHEFKTPINAIEGYTTLLQGNPDCCEEEFQYAEKILVNTKRLSDLVSNILLLSKIENQAIPPKQEAFALDEQLRQAVVSLERKWNEKDIELEAELDAVSYVGNEALLFRVWVNLLDNAIKFTPCQGNILVGLKASEQNVLVSIKDSGCGIGEGEMKRIFERFYQADTSHRDEGNGLGLALVNRIVALHDGHIDVENCPEGGCRFTVVLPVRKSIA